MDDKSVKDEEKKADVLEAIKYQTKYKLDSMAGIGVDRHLFGLYVAGKMAGSVPEVFGLTVRCVFGCSL